MLVILKILKNSRRLQIKCVVILLNQKSCSAGMYHNCLSNAPCKWNENIHFSLTKNTILLNQLFKF